MPYPPLARSTDAIDRFLATACMVGIEVGSLGCLNVYAPSGHDDLDDMLIKPNRTSTFSADCYKAKAASWLLFWPELQIIEPPSDGS